MADTAYESYYEAIDEGKLPAAIPVVSLEAGNVGLSTSPVPFARNVKASALVNSPDWKQRAVAAILACHHARKSVLQHYENIRPVSP